MIDPDDIARLQEGPTESPLDPRVKDWEPRPMPDDYGKEPTSKPDPRIKKPKQRRGPAQ